MSKPRTYKRLLRSGVLELVASLMVVSVTLAASSNNYNLNWMQSGAGGSEAGQSTSFHLNVTSGQSTGGNGSSTSYHAYLGYRISEGGPTATSISGPTRTNTPPPPSNTPTHTNTPLPTQTPGGPSATPVPSNTPVPPTNTLPPPSSTPVPPTNTPIPPTQTPGGPTATPIPSNTPVPPTNTPLPTQTPGGPSATPIPTDPSSSATPTDCPNPFADISGNIFYYAIHYLNCRHVVGGTDATHYSPAGTSTRGQFAKVVVLGFGAPFYTPDSGQDFSDVTPTFFAYLYIESGFHAGILSGFDTNTCTANHQPYPCYLPNRPITRGQLTKLVVNAAHYPLYTPSGGIQTYNDVPPTNVFFVSIETAHFKGVINGYADHTFRPNNNIRRDEMAQIVFKGVTIP